MNPEVDLVDLLAAAGIGLTAGTNLFEGPAREPDGTLITSPVVNVQVASSTIDPYFGGPTGPDYISAMVRVLVRGNRNDYSAARTLARQIISTAHKAQITGYTKVVALNAEPADFEDKEGRPALSFYIIMEGKEAR